MQHLYHLVSRMGYLGAIYSPTSSLQWSSKVIGYAWSLSCQVAPDWSCAPLNLATCLAMLVSHWSQLLHGEFLLDPSGSVRRSLLLSSIASSAQSLRHTTELVWCARWQSHLLELFAHSVRCAMGLFQCTTWAKARLSVLCALGSMCRRTAET